ncbi:MAG: DciA family protein, partial [Planctomycetota bacterium]|nr:DciA family protein [Planctomycetota bacterium]
MSAPTPRRGGRRGPARMEGDEPKRGKLMPLGDALAEFLRDSKLLQRKKQQPAYDAWDEAVGPELARQARAVSFR